MSYVPSLKKLYVEQIVPELVKTRGYKNKHEVPKLVKIFDSTQDQIENAFAGTKVNPALKLFRRIYRQLNGISSKS
jgi:ribosomal protein L5